MDPQLDGSPLADDGFFWKERDCTHHWLIEPANGPESMGECRHCGERRSFTNNPDALPLRADSEPRRYAVRNG